MEDMVGSEDAIITTTMMQAVRAAQRPASDISDPKIVSC